jgi:uncharacterized membrane protein YdjX (TVP38/TMEM64 family)
LAFPTRRFLPASALIDPERRARLQVLTNEFVPPDFHRPVAARIARFAVEMLLVAVLVVLDAWIMPGSLRASAAQLPALGVLADYVLAGMLVLPVTLLIVAIAALFSPSVAGAYALGGVLLSAAATYGAGRALGRHAVRRLAGSRLNDITRRLAGEGMLSVAILRLVPIAPFSIVNAVAGASRVPLRDFLPGTAIGMAPLIALAVAFVDRVRAAFADPARRSMPDWRRSPRSSPSACSSCGAGSEKHELHPPVSAAAAAGAPCGCGPAGAQAAVCASSAPVVSWALRPRIRSVPLA